MIFDAAVYISPQCQAYNQSANESMTALLGIHRLDIYIDIITVGYNKRIQNYLSDITPHIVKHRKNLKVITS